MSSMQTGQAIARTKRLVALYERRMITDASVVSEIVSLVSPDNIRDVLRTLPPALAALVRDWAKLIPDDGTTHVVFWPVSEGVRLSFKEWVREQEEAERKNRNGS